MHPMNSEPRTHTAVMTVAEPREWYAVPLAVIDEAIGLRQAETIADFRYDAEQQRIVLAG